MKAERETADRLIAHFLADRIGAEFTGRISGVTRAGLFVKLADTGADGFVPARTLGTEYFQYDEKRQAMIGKRSGAMHRLGDVVGVRLVEAAPVAGALRFELLSNDSRTPDARRSFRKDREREIEARHHRRNDKRSQPSGGDRRAENFGELARRDSRNRNQKKSRGRKR
jgi:ribonuclease R